MKSFYSNGKLLLTGEYVVLDGAMALAVPSIYGQSLHVETREDELLQWTSLDEHGAIWLDITFKLSEQNIFPTTIDDDISIRLLQILNAARQLNPKFLSSASGYTITTELGFPKNWGLGTSSTLISNIATWANIDAYKLLELTFGGSGYDIACAKALGSLLFQIENDDINNKKKQIVTAVDFNPSFKNHIYFVYLNQKQNSRDGIKQYRDNASNASSSIKTINNITNHMISCESLDEFEKLMTDHEELISEIIKVTPIKKRLFNDFNGSIKSLGAWGGDFVMVASKNNPTAYFKSKGYNTILPYTEMVKN
nr:GYDIA family GHMP kinase [uncultured Psychroserpens sp.]